MWSTINDPLLINRVDEIAAVMVVIACQWRKIVIFSYIVVNEVAFEQGKVRKGKMRLN